MDAKELRLGNLIDNDGVIIETDRYIIKNSNMPTVWEHYKPIPLTEDWLVKLGFQKHKEHGRYGYRYFIGVADYGFTVERDFNEHLSHFFGHEWYDSGNDDDDHKPWIISFNLKYVHSLQNLYFALTSKELTLNN